MSIAKEQLQPVAAYREYKALSYSGAKDILVSPAYYVYQRKTPKAPTQAMEDGTLAHFAGLYTEEQFKAWVVKGPEGVRRGTKAWDAFLATLSQGQYDVKPDEFENLLAIGRRFKEGVDRLLAHLGWRREDCDFLVETAFIEDYAGTKIKGRPDMVITHKPSGEKVVVDLKTCVSCRPKAFRNDIGKFSYHVQQAFYLKLTGATRFFFIAVEKEGLNEYAIHELDEASAAEGVTTMDLAVSIFRRCEATGVWPEADKGPFTLSLNKWHMGDQGD